MKESKKFNYFCWALIASFYLLENCIQVSQNVLTPLMRNELGLHGYEFSVVVACYFWGYSVVQIPVGIILDKFGVKKPLFFAVMACGIGTIALAKATGFYTTLIARTTVGVASAFAALSGLNYAARNFSKDRFATLTGLLLTIGMSGQIFGEEPLHYLAEFSGWRHSLMFLGLAAILIASFNCIYLPDDKPKTKADDKIDLKSILKKSDVWHVAIYAMLRFTPFLLFVTFWGNPLITKIHTITDASAARLVGMLPLGFAIGAPIWGSISDKMQKRKPVLIISNILELFLWLTLSFKIGEIPADIVALILGFSVSGFLPAFTIMKEITPAQLRTTALGFMNTLNSIGTPIAMPIVVIIAKGLSAQATLWILPVMTFCAMILFLRIKEPGICQN